MNPNRRPTVPDLPDPLSVPCPVPDCGSRVGVQCRWPGGMPRDPHERRRVLAVAGPPTPQGPAPVIVPPRDWLYVAPALRGHERAEEFDRYLDDLCRWSCGDGRLAGIAWLWTDPIPPRQDWWDAVLRLNVSLREAERTQEGKS